MALGDVHKMMGCHVSYVLKFECGEESFHVYETSREAMLAEIALCSLWAGKLGHDRVRGGQWNMGTPMPFPPPARSESWSGGSPRSP